LSGGGVHAGFHFSIAQEPEDFCVIFAIRLVLAILPICQRAPINFEKLPAFYAGHL
jgi:hypothetical protein